MTPGTNPWDDARRRDDERLLTSLLVGAAVAGGVLLLVRSSRLRRLAWLGTRFALTTWLPAWGATQLNAAWTESRPAPRVPALATPPDADRA